MDEFDLLSPESQGIIAEPPSSLPENYRRALEFKNKRMMEAAAAAQLAKDVAGITASFQGRGPTNVVAPMEIRNTALSPEQSAQIDLDAARRARIANIGGGQVDLRNPAAGPLRMGPVPQQADPNADYGADEQARRAMMAARMREVAAAARMLQERDPYYTIGTRYGRNVQAVPEQMMPTMRNPQMGQDDAVRFALQQQGVLAGQRPDNVSSVSFSRTPLADSQAAGKAVLQNAIARDKAYEQKKAENLAALRKSQAEAGMDPMQLARARALESLGMGGKLDSVTAVLLGPEFADMYNREADRNANRNQKELGPVEQNQFRAVTEETQQQRAKDKAKEIKGQYTLPSDDKRNFYAVKTFLKDLPLAPQDDVAAAQFLADIGYSPEVMGWITGYDEMGNPTGNEEEWWNPDIFSGFVGTKRTDADGNVLPSKLEELRGSLDMDRVNRIASLIRSLKAQQKQIVRPET